MYGIYTYIFHKCKPHGSKYSIHGASGVYTSFLYDTAHIQAVQNTLSPFVFFLQRTRCVAVCRHAPTTERQGGPRRHERQV